VPPGDFFFILPYQGPGGTGDLAFSTTLRQADVFFSVDTTGSFGEEIDAIRAAISTTIVPGVTAVIPNPAFGVGRFEDFPLDPFGLAGDKPFQLLQTPTTDLGLLTAGVDALPPASGGLDTPEAGYEALYQWATGAGFPEFAIPAFSGGAIGGAGFRGDSLPIILQITDARSHLPAEYAPFAAAAHDEADAVAALGAIGARVIGINSLENVGTADDPRVVTLEANAQLRFVPDTVEVKKGETIRFEITNTAGFPHNFWIGPQAEVEKKNTAALKGTPDFSEGTQALEVTFDGDGPYAFGCFIPGHYEAGMKGTIALVP